MVTYKKITYDNAKVQVDSAIRDGNGATIATTYATVNALNGKLSAPSVQGSAGQVLKLDQSGIPVWDNDSGTAYTAGTGISISGTVISTSFTLGATDVELTES